MERWSRQQHERFLRALEAGEAVRPGAEPVALLQHAVFAARRGHFVAARRSARAALRLAPRVGVVGVVAGMVLYVTRDYDEALRCLRRTGAANPRSAETAYHLALERAARLGWTSDQRDLLETLTALRTRSLRVVTDVARFHVEARAWGPALVALRRACELESTSPSLWMERASVASRHPTDAREHRAEEVARSVARALDLVGGDGGFALPYLLEGARCLTRAGELDEAAACLDRAADVAPASVDVALELGERALWRVDLEEVGRQVARLHRLGEDAGARRLEGGCAVLSGRHEAALRILQPVRGDYRADLWRAEALLASGRMDEAHEALTRASMTSDGFLPVAWLTRLRVGLQSSSRLEDLRRHHFGEVRDLLLAIDAHASLDAQAILRRGRPEEVEGLLTSCAECLGGNRSTTPTVTRDGTLRRLPPLEGEREASRRALELVRALEPDEVLAALEDVAARFEGHALPAAHRGELLLWLGRYTESRRALEEAIAIRRETRWPYIGLTALDILEGQPERALETSAHGVQVMNGTVGAAVHVHVGEALRRLGRHDEAIAALERAVALHPGRLSAAINLVLARRARDPSDDVSTLVADIFEQAPGLLSDAAASLSIVLWRSPDQLELDRLDEVLERALELMRGNRSSSILTYVTEDGRLRSVPHRGSQRGPHAGDEDDLMRARGLLMRAVGIGASCRARETTRATPAQLTPQQLEMFLADGYLRLPRAVDAKVARQWRQRALEHLRRAPHRCVKGWDDRVSLDALDPDDPSTWVLDRIDCALDAAWPYAELMPKAWPILCALVGGRERLQTHTMGEYLILNLRERANLGAVAPHPQWGSWHMDAPSERARIDDFRNGLVLVVLFDDVEIDRGPTYIAPESIREVAREMANGEVDFVDRTSAARIMQRCRRLVPLIGDVGDVYVLHPFMLHSSSPNPSGRIRWMSNPVLFMREPLRFHSPAPSPVEEVVVRALRD